MRKHQNPDSKDKEYYTSFHCLFSESLYFHIGPVEPFKYIFNIYLYFHLDTDRTTKRGNEYK